MSGRKPYYFALGVLLVESFVALGMLMSWLISYFIAPQLASDFGLGPVAIIWFRVVLGFMFVIQAAMTVLLAKAINRKDHLWLQAWIIAQFVHFILTLITVILSTMGWMGFEVGYSFIILNAVSLVYRLVILKFVSDFKEGLPENDDIDVCDNSKPNAPNAKSTHDHRKRASSSSSIRSASKIISHV